MVTVIILALLIWLILGASGFIYWWTTEYDLETGEIPILIVVSLIGPLSWGVGYLIHK